MFTLRKMFSSSFVASAARQDETGTSVLMARPYNALAALQTGRRVTADHLRNHLHLAVRIARVFAFRRKSQMKIRAGLQPGPRFQHRPQILVRRARIGRGFQHHRASPFAGAARWLLPVSMM